VMSPCRQIRTRLGPSQAECATALGVALETLRTWDSGRRPAPEALVIQAQRLTAKRPPHSRVPLQVLADEFHVHVRTLRAAAHDGGCGTADYDPFRRPGWDTRRRRRLRICEIPNACRSITLRGSSACTNGRCEPRYEPVACAARYASRPVVDGATRGVLADRDGLANAEACPGSERQVRGDYTGATAMPPKFVLTA